MESNSALIVVDMQNDFCHPKGSFAERGIPIVGSPETARNIQLLVDAYHQTGLPVYFVKTEHDAWTDTEAWRAASQRDDAPQVTDPGRVCVTGEWGAEYFEVAPSVVDFEIIKHRHSAFYDTPLASSLRAQDRTTLIITGVATNVCVEATARDACMADFRSVVVADACAAASSAEHSASLYNIDTYFGSVCDTSELVDRFAGKVVAAQK